jgi:hypothetical protein
MAAWMPPTDLPPSVAVRSPADPHCWLVDLATALAETDKLLSGRSQLSQWRADGFGAIKEALQY